MLICYSLHPQPLTHPVTAYYHGPIGGHCSSTSVSLYLLEGEHGTYLQSLDEDENFIQSVYS